MSKHQRDRLRNSKDKFGRSHDSKPQSNRLMCPQCGRMKQLFETEREAKNFIRFNADNLAYGSERLRAYWCDGCAGWHITSHEYKESYEGMTDRLIESAKRFEKSNKIENLIEAQQIWNAIPTDVRDSDLKGFSKYVKNSLGVDLNSATYQRGVIRLYKEYHEI